MIKKLNSAIIQLHYLGEECLKQKDYQEYYTIECEIAYYETLKHILNANNSI